MRRLIALFVVGFAVVASNCSLNTAGKGLFEETGGASDASVGGAGSGGAAAGGAPGKGGAAGNAGAGGTGTGGLGGNPPGGAAGNAGVGGTGTGGLAGNPAGGAAGQGGNTGEGGTAGSTGSGGTTGTGGSTGAGGATGTGGSTGEGGAAGSDAAVCNLTALPAPTVHPLDSHVINVRINGGGAVANNVAPGSQVSVLYDFQIKNSNPCECPGCWQQIYVGFAGVETNTCSNQQRGCPGNTGINEAVTLTAPAQPGTYYLSAASTWEWDCITATPSMDSAAYVGAICVK